MINKLLEVPIFLLLKLNYSLHKRPVLPLKIVHSCLRPRHAKILTTLEEYASHATGQAYVKYFED